MEGTIQTKEEVRGARFSVSGQQTPTLLDAEALLENTRSSY